MWSMNIDGGRHDMRRLAVLSQFLMAPYFGPGLLPHAQKLWIDDLTVGNQRIGPSKH